MCKIAPPPGIGLIVDLYKKHCNGYTYISPTAGNFIMYKNREMEIEKSDDLDKIVRKTNLINKKVINVNESF